MTKQELLQGYKNIKKILDYLIDRYGIMYTASETAPSTYEGMVAHYEKHGVYSVFSDGDHGLLGEEYNLKFRAVHDAMHRHNRLTFSFEDEIKLSQITSELFVTLAYKVLYTNALDAFDVGTIIDAEIAGQIRYYQRTKTYIADQTEFIYNRFNIKETA